MMSSARGVLTILALAGLAAPALAADLPARTAAPLFKEVDTSWSPWQIRVRALGVLPDSSAKWYAGGSQLAGAGAKVSNSIVPELDVSYFFTKNIAVEAICCVSPHSIKGTGTLDGLNVGKTLVFPPTVLLQYHFTELGALQPYLGAGVNYTHFFNTESGDALATDHLGLGGTSKVTALKIKDSFGFALQAGVDYMIDRHWGINVDVKKVWMRPDASGVVTNTVAGAVPVTAKVKIDPWLVGAGVTYRF